jgi:NAD(P)-dependent dehydrogenase (short-subunit alcohol dehydrogenase family)
VQVSSPLRPGLLTGTPLIVASAGGEPGELAAAAADACRELGAEVIGVAVDPGGDEPAVSVPDGGQPVVVWDAAGAFDAAGEQASVASVRAALDGAWLAARAVATAAMIPAARGGSTVLVAPRPGTPHHEAVRAGLENLARTLGIEWSRFGIRTVTVLPGATTPAAEVAQIVAYLASRAGAYFSGCALTLGAVE